MINFVISYIVLLIFCIGCCKILKTDKIVMMSFIPVINFYLAFCLFTGIIIHYMGQITKTVHTSDNFLTRWISK